MPAFAIVFAICEGSSSCSQTWIQAVAGAVLIGALAAALSFRYVRINARRRAQGLPPLRWRSISETRGKDSTLVRVDRATLETETGKLRRQIEWERHVAATEMARYGRARTRAYCKQHDRYCKEPIAQPHPAGGIDNVEAPSDWKAL